MEKYSQKEIIKKYLESVGDWVLEYKIRCIETPFGFVGARGDRSVREMFHDGEIDGKIEGKYRWVRAKRPEIVKKFENIPAMKKVGEKQAINLLFN